MLSSIRTHTLYEIISTEQFPAEVTIEQQLKTHRWDMEYVRTALLYVRN